MLGLAGCSRYKALMPRRYLRRNTASHIRSVNTGGAEFCRGPGTRAVGASQDPGLDDRRGLFSSCFVHPYSYRHVAYERYGVAFLLPKRTMTANPKNMRVQSRLEKTARENALTVDYEVQAGWPRKQARGKTRTLKFSVSTMHPRNLDSFG